jgi:hypothetical protein
MQLADLESFLENVLLIVHFGIGLVSWSSHEKLWFALSARDAGNCSPMCTKLPLSAFQIANAGRNALEGPGLQLTDLLRRSSTGWPKHSFSRWQRSFPTRWITDVNAEEFGSTTNVSTRGPKVRADRRILL